MVPSDRLLTALGVYLSGKLDGEYPPRLRDWSGTKGAAELVLDADEPSENGGLDGVYSISGVVALRLKARDFEDETRRNLLGDLEESLTEAGGDPEELAVIEFLNDDLADRGIGELGLEVYELRSDGGAWEREEKWLVGKLEFTAQFSGRVS
jgi:hypothetical protein